MTAKDRSQRPGSIQTAVEILGGKAAHLPTTQATRVSTNDATRVSPAVSNVRVPAPQPVQVRKEASGMVYVEGGALRWDQMTVARMRNLYGMYILPPFGSASIRSPKKIGGI